MYFKKYLFSFVITLIYFTCYCESGLYEIHENNILGFSSSDMKSVFLNNGGDLMLSLLNDNVWNAVEEECKCVNGRCEKVCAEWKDGACRRTKKACVCSPEFVKNAEEKCIYCDCGKGFNCTYDRSSRTDYRICACPEGYYDYAHECALFCNENRPCQNGGTCKNGKCACHFPTHGPFCERIANCAYECRPRLTVDCVYNQEERTYECLCKNRSLVFDYKEMICKPCPCGEGTCTFKNHRLQCKCKPGYQEFQTQCRKCDCGPDHGCEILYSGEKSCKCLKGFFIREGTCLPCECGHDEAQCRLDEAGRKVCICPEGYEDILGLCQRKKGNCTCHLPTANCIETEEGFDCVCKEGYMQKDHREPNPEEPCEDIDECYVEKRCQQSDHQKCVNFPGSYMCNVRVDTNQSVGLAIAEKLHVKNINLPGYLLA